jgi:hypothetical protein
MEWDSKAGLPIAKTFGYSRFFVANTSKIGGKIEEKRRAFRMEMVAGPTAFFG